MSGVCAACLRTAAWTFARSFALSTTRRVPPSVVRQVEPAAVSWGSTWGKPVDNLLIGLLRPWNT
jgi:hypothetical protein